MLSSIAIVRYGRSWYPASTSVACRLMLVPVTPKHGTSRQSLHHDQAHVEYSLTESDITMFGNVSKMSKNRSSEAQSPSRSRSAYMPSYPHIEVRIEKANAAENVFSSYNGCMMHTICWILEDSSSKFTFWYLCDVLNELIDLSILREPASSNGNASDDESRSTR